MSDPEPDTAPDTTHPTAARWSTPQGAADNTGGIESHRVDPDLAHIDPTGGE